MPEQLVELEPPLPAELADELSKRVYFVSDEIVGFSLVRSDDAITAVRLRTSGATPPADLDRKLRTLVATDVAPQRPVRADAVWHAAPGRVHEGVFEQLVDAGAAYEAGEGQVGLGEPVLGLLEYLDDRVRDIAVGRLGATEYRYPTLIPTAVLSRIGYFTSFPQHLMFVTRLHSDLDVYAQLSRDIASGGSPHELVLAHCRNVDYALPPTMCFHTYHQFSGGTVPSDGLVVTSRGPSFRFESRYRYGLERLWDFTIREVVFLGERGFVLACRQRFLEAAIELAEELDLGGSCELANDPFFLGDSAERVWSQRMLELKYELRLDVGPDRTAAVASFNFHEGFFGDAFDIRRPDETRIHTACVGFGLERFALAFLAQHGLDPAEWPNVVGRGLRSGRG
jgi:seryl-tRNA synthetase